MALYRALGSAAARAGARGRCVGAGPHARARLPGRAEARAAWLSPPRSATGRSRSSGARCSSSASSRSSSARSAPREGLRCLDLGSDNGVVSLLLRERGGSWASGDLTEEAVASIRSLVARRRPPRRRGPAALRGRGVRPRRGGRHARARARRSRLRARARPRHEAGRAAGRQHAAPQAHAAATSAPRARPDRREARPPAPRLHARAARASCWPRPSSSRATAPTRASSRRRSTPPSTGAWSASARSPRPRAWW